MKQLTTEQRYQIEAYLKAGMSKDFIAEALPVNRSGIFREVKRNSTKRKVYHAAYAQMLCNERKERLKRNRVFDRHKEKLVKNYLEKEQWSPQQITMMTILVILYRSQFICNFVAINTCSAN